MTIQNNVATMLQPCVALKRSSLRIVSCNITLKRSYVTDRNQELENHGSFYLGCLS